jgi:hypothetical protein
MDDKMNIRIMSVVLLSVILVVLILAPPSSADESDSPEEQVLGVAYSCLLFTDFGASLFNGLLLLTDRGWVPLGWIGIASGGATIVSSAIAPLWAEDDDSLFLAFALTGVAIGGITTALGIIQKRHAQNDRQRQESRATSVSPSVVRSGNGKLTPGVVVQIAF